MTNLWVPVWAGAVSAGVFVVVAFVHAGHITVMSGRHRGWHAGHVLMAVGMAVMFWPAGGAMLVPTGVGTPVYDAAAVLLVVGLGGARLRGRRLGPLWWASVVDLAAMAYMFAVMSTRVAWLSVLASAWFAAQALGWASGWLGGRLEHGGLGDRVPPTHASPEVFDRPGATISIGPQAAAAAGAVGAGEATTQARDRLELPTAASGAAATTVTVGAAAWVVTAARQRVIDGGRGDWSVRITLTVMPIGMGYMLLAMQFGVPATGMPGMAGTGGM